MKQLCFSGGVVIDRILMQSKNLPPTYHILHIFKIHKVYKIPPHNYFAHLHVRTSITT